MNFAALQALLRKLYYLAQRFYRKITMKILHLHVLRLLILFVVILTTAAGAADLNVKVNGLEVAAGRVRVGLFNVATDYPKKQFRGEIVVAQVGSVTVAFKDLSPGIYAVSVFHDINDNEKLDANGVGLPSEPHGFSRDARGIFGPPSFENAAFSVAEGVSTIELKLK